MLIGCSQHRIDKKGRVVIPAKFRAEMGACVVCTVGLDGCIAIYPIEEWNRYLEKLNSLPFTRAQARKFMRVLLGSAEEVNLDAQGRVLLDARLREYAQLNEDVTVSGVLNHLEIWDAVKWAAQNDEMMENFTELAEGVGEFGI